MSNLIDVYFPSFPSFSLFQIYAAMTKDPGLWVHVKFRILRANVTVWFRFLPDVDNPHNTVSWFLLAPEIIALTFGTEFDLELHLDLITGRQCSCDGIVMSEHNVWAISLFLVEVNYYIKLRTNFWFCSLQNRRTYVAKGYNSQSLNCQRELSERNYEKFAIRKL